MAVQQEADQHRKPEQKKHKKLLPIAGTVAGATLALTAGIKWLNDRETPPSFDNQTAGQSLSTPIAGGAQENKPAPPLSGREPQPEPGWKQFISFNNPYKINYPEEMRVETDGRYDEQPADRFVGRQNTIVIYAKPIPSWITLETYVKQEEEKMTEMVLGKYDYGKRQKLPDKLFSEVEVKMDGSPAFLLQTAPIPTNEPDKYSREYKIFFIAFGKIWTVRTGIDQSVPEAHLQLMKMLGSFRFASDRK